MSAKGSQNRAQVDKLLTNVSNMLKPEGFVSESLLTPLKVIQDSGIIPAYGNGHLRIVNSRQKGRGRARMSNAIERVTTNKYYIEKHALQSEVTEEDYRNVEQPYEAEQDEVVGVTTQIHLEKEYALASVVTNTSTITQNTTLTGNQKFSDYSNSNPINVIKSALQAVREGCGMPANKAVLDWSVVNVLRYHPQILENLGFAANRAGQLTEQEIAKALGVDVLLVAKSVYNSAKEGQTDVIAPVWGKDIVFMHCPVTAAKQQVSFGYYVNKGATRRVKTWAINESFENTGILVDDSYSFELVNVNAAYLIKDAIA